ncbi:MAG: pimeloyl-ACP methyl ester esterase BioH [Gallionellaceae bacterium]|nr:pimeloyl-ACP methyl ester esterase BioH [Gallionellaceae bacterium]
MRLHVESLGSGPALVMLHGWGMHGGIWGKAVIQLAQHFRVHSVDLPGHGKSSGLMPYNLDSIVQHLQEHFTEPVALCGWSLGGQVALHWAHLAPQQISKMVLVATTPSFVQRPDWPCAMAAVTLQEFSAALLAHPERTLLRFIALQVRGSEYERQLLQDLRSGLYSRGIPDKAALQSGLEILRDTDLRAQLPHITPATLLIAGEHDLLTPPDAASYLVQAIPQAQLLKIKGAAHVPFLSHSDIFVQEIVKFLEE